MSKHTPGPWDLHVDEDSGEFQINMGDARKRNSGYQSQQRIEVDFSLYPDDGEQWDEAYANMRLIAAAPELLESLMQAAKQLESGIQTQCGAPDEPPQPASQWDYEAGLLVGDLLRLIAKATGAA